MEEAAREGRPSWPRCAQAAGSWFLLIPIPVVDTNMILHGDHRDGGRLCDPQLSHKFKGHAILCDLDLANSSLAEATRRGNAAKPRSCNSAMPGRDPWDRKVNPRLSLELLP